MSRLMMKFGGTSVGSPAAIGQLVEIIKRHLAQGHQLAVVVSAMSGVTDLLLETAQAAVSGDRDRYLAINESILDSHLAVISQLIPDSAQQEQIDAEVRELLRSHRELCDAIRILGEMTPRICRFSGVVWRTIEQPRH